MNAAVRCPQAINIYKICSYGNKKARIVQSWKKENNKQNKMNQNKGVNSY